jgi:hypothetical protein
LLAISSAAAPFPAALIPPAKSKNIIPAVTAFLILCPRSGLDPRLLGLNNSNDFKRYTGGFPGRFCSAPRHAEHVIYTADPIRKQISGKQRFHRFTILKDFGCKIFQG